ncbi:hypothetical protein T11_18447 [Trichinella zimbabwensis]|uniref:Uncharacterized protein n=1 Tax=Trichinella zimbabwensis TaxID=268475 RepID=A0A0V1HTE5_9BILA|nr:hypothetical protein T11_18447 [Trichinella zimbabwensis]
MRRIGTSRSQIKRRYLKSNLCHCKPQQLQICIYRGEGGGTSNSCTQTVSLLLNGICKNSWDTEKVRPAYIWRRVVTPRTPVPKFDLRLYKGNVTI